MTLHDDIVHQVKRSLVLLGATPAEVAALDTASPQAMYRAIQRAGGTSDILRVIGSYRDTKPN